MQVTRLPGQWGALSMTEVRILSNLPVQPTNFIGREEVLATISQTLSDGSCRLITLVGPGGIGKTRLAIQSAYTMENHFADGAYFVTLQAVSSPDMMVMAVFDALKFSLQGHNDPLAQLLRTLHDKQLLLILDSFEHLVQSVDLLLELLEHAPQVKLLVTSREVLNLRQEWVVPISGLQFPDSLQSEDAESFGAVRLFVECARRVQPQFSLADERMHVIRLCQIVDGVPLAIELAASWLKSLPCAEIVLEVQRNLDFLDTKLRDLPARHRNIRAVFDHSWTLLLPKEQNVFSSLAIFRGGFRRDAAERVAGASISHLSALIDKSLIRIDNAGRYQIHELLRQYAEEKLDQQPNLKNALREQHCAYYAAFLDGHCRNLAGGKTSTIYDQVMEDVDNIWAAWDYALTRCDEEIIAQFLVPLYRLVNEQNRYYDGERIFRRALSCLEGLDDQFSLTQARASLCLALCLQNLTRYDEASIFAEKAVPVLEVYDAKWELWNAQSCLANIAYARGDYARAQAHFEHVREMLLPGDDASALVIALTRLSDLAAVRGDYEAAKRFLSESVAELEAAGNNRSRIRFLLTLGDIEHKIGNYEKAEAHFVAALSLSRAMENTMTHAISLVSLARVAYAVRDFSRSEELCRESITLFDEIRHLWGKAFALVQLGRVTAELERFDETYQHFYNATTIAESTGSQWLKAVCYANQGSLHVLIGREEHARNDLHKALAIAAEVNTEPLILDILAAIAEAGVIFGYETWALPLTVYVAANPHSEFAMRERAAARLQRLHAANMPMPETAISSITAYLLAILEDGFDAVEPSLRFAAEHLTQPKAVLDALTERELEILRLVADGHPNRAIAELLILEIGTVKAHNHNIFSKLGVNNRVQAITRARELHLI